MSKTTFAKHFNDHNIYFISAVIVLFQEFLFFALNNGSFSVFMLKDGQFYLGNAHDYTYYTFFPLVSWLIKLFGGSVAVALILQCIYLFLAFVLLYKITKSYIPVLVVALFPDAFLLHANLSEGLFLLLTLLIVYGSQKDKWFFVTLCGVLIGLTRSNGFLVSILICFLLLFNNNNLSLKTFTSAYKNHIVKLIKNIIALISPMIGTVIYLTFCYLRTGDAFILTKQELQGWGMQFSFPFWAFLKSSENDNRMLLGNPYLQGILYIVLAVVILVLIIYSRQNRVYKIYGVVYILFLTCLQTGGTISFLRFLLPCFPLFLALTDVINYADAKYRQKAKYFIFAVMFIFQIACFLFWVKAQIVFT